MTHLFWYLRLTPSLAAVNRTQLTAKVTEAVLETELGAVLLLAVFGSHLPVSPSKGRWQLMAIPAPCRAEQGLWCSTVLVETHPGEVRAGLCGLWKHTGAQGGVYSFWAKAERLWAHSSLSVVL